MVECHPPSHFGGDVFKVTADTEKQGVPCWYGLTMRSISRNDKRSMRSARPPLPA